MLSSLTFWFWISRLGESPIVLPIAVALVLVFLAFDAHRVLRVWALALVVAIGVTSVSKIAFLGWGLGIAALDFTGFSGHAMLSASIYPVLGHVFARRRQASTAWWGAAMGCALAALIAVSRVTTHAHSVSETVLGFMLGCAVSATAMGFRAPSHMRIPRWAWLSAAAWLAAMPFVSLPFNTHQAVIKVALVLSQRPYPYQRADLHRPALTSLQPGEGQAATRHGPWRLAQ
jgi:membrane-associated phospholipid phosphatase